MRLFYKSRVAKQGGWTLTEVTVAMAISSILCAGVITASILLEKSFLASRFHIIAQAEQMLLMDYMNLDLRRALTVTAGPSQLTLTIPDYYDGNNQPRDPVIQNDFAVYGTTPKTITYYQSGSTVYRNDGVNNSALATDVSDFQLAFQDLGQSIQISITFLPKFQFSGNSSESVRNGTATYSVTLLRNKR